MCVIYWAQSERFQLVLAANRDEFLARPTTPAAFHDFTPPSHNDTVTEPTATKRVLSGLDLEGGGTWLGVSTAQGCRLKFATLTNYAETLDTTPRPSRGNLVKDFLDNSNGQLAEYLSTLEATKAEYAGFNLLLGVVDDQAQWRMGYVSNRNGEEAREIAMPELGSACSVSNSTLTGEPWPKCQQGIEAVSKVVNSSHDDQHELTEGLWGALSVAQPKPITDRTHLRQTILVRPAFMNPKAPVPPEPVPWEPSPDGTPTPDPAEPIPDADGKMDGQNGYWYGTRVQTVILVEREAQNGKLKVTFKERDAYVASADGPRWSGTVRTFNFRV